VIDAHAIRQATPDDLARILASLPEFWGERDVRHLHHPMFVREFADTALVVPAAAGGIAAYLLGFVAPGGTGYVHVVGVSRAHRRCGLGRVLYERFATLARERGATSLKAVTSPGNHGSVAFHRSLGMSATLVADYAGPGEDRVVMTGPIGTDR
jgi:L-amino acid N-acyltransferase YncA